MTEGLGFGPEPRPVPAQHLLDRLWSEAVGATGTLALPVTAAWLLGQPLTRNFGLAPLQLLPQNPLLCLLRKVFYSFEKHVFLSLSLTLVRGVRGAGRLHLTLVFRVALPGPSWAARFGGDPQTGSCLPWPVGARNCGWLTFISWALWAHPEAGDQGQVPASLWSVGSLFWSIPSLSRGTLWGPSFVEGGSPAPLLPLSTLRLPAGYFRATETHLP